MNYVIDKWKQLKFWYKWPVNYSVYLIISKMMNVWPSAKQATVWKHFKWTSEKCVTCIICKKELKYFGNTTNMKEHLRHKHPLQTFQPHTCSVTQLNQMQGNTTDNLGNEQTSCYEQSEASTSQSGQGPPLVCTVLTSPKCLRLFRFFTLSRNELSESEKRLWTGT